MGITAIAFDFGTKSIGCAVGQSITGTAQALPAFKAQDGIPNWDAIEKCLKDWKPDVVVVGLPLNMDGTEHDNHHAGKFHRVQKPLLNAHLVVLL